MQLNCIWMTILHNSLHDWLCHLNFSSLDRLVSWQATCWRLDVLRQGHSWEAVKESTETDVWMMYCTTEKLKHSAAQQQQWHFASSALLPLQCLVCVCVCVYAKKLLFSLAFCVIWVFCTFANLISTGHWNKFILKILTHGLGMLMPPAPQKNPFSAIRYFPKMRLNQVKSPF